MYYLSEIKSKCTKFNLVIYLVDSNHVKLLQITFIAVLYTKTDLLKVFNCKLVLDLLKFFWMPKHSNAREYQNGSMIKILFISFLIKKEREKRFFTGVKGKFRNV